jgi:hypothetical protein
MNLKKKSLPLVVFGVIALILAFGMTNVAQAFEWADGRMTLNGYYKNWTMYRFGFYGKERGDGLSMFRNTLQLEAEAKVLPEVSLYTIFRMTREPNYPLEDDFRDAGLYDGDNLDENSFREWYLTWQATERWWFKFGKQQVVWGDLGGLGLRVMDFVNALDARWHYALDAFEDVRIPLIMFNTIYSIPAMSANLQFIWVPGLEDTYDRVTWAHTSSGLRWGVNTPGDHSFFFPGAGFSPGDPLPFPEPATKDTPGIDKKLSDSDVGMRWQQTVGGVTYALMAAYSHEQNPAVDGEYKRRSIFGGSLNWYNNTIKSVIRSEIGYFPNVPLANTSFEVVKDDIIKFGFGLDRNTFFDWLSPTRSLLNNWQIIGEWNTSHDDDVYNLFYGEKLKEWNVNASVYLNWGWDNDRMQVHAQPLYNFSTDDGLFMAWFDYKPQQFGGNLTLTIPKVILLYGRDPYAGGLGIVRGCSEGGIEIKYEF